MELDFIDKIDTHISSAALFHHLYVPNISRSTAKLTIITKYCDRQEEGIFILRDAHHPPYPIPTGMNHQYCICYWNHISNRFNSLLICSDNTYMYWMVLIDENEFQEYPSLKDILYDIPSIRNTSIKNALVLKNK